MPLLKLREAYPAEDWPEVEGTEPFVDIIAVHGLNENMTQAWTDPTTNVLWLQDLLPSAIRVARVLTFGYNAHPSLFYGSGSADRIQQHAHTLVADVQADRSLEGYAKRPIVFVCHGLGGILVKKALSYSSTRTSKNVEHLYSMFVSTYAILFFGTPHHGTDKASWLAMAQAGNCSASAQLGEESQLLSAIEKDSETLQAITDQFAPIMKQFHIFFFWEGVQSDFGGRTAYVVEEPSAAPMMDNTERAGIEATHSQMVRFGDTQSSSYRTVLEALMRYCRHAPPIISRRWQQAAAYLSQTRSNEAMELSGTAFNVHENNSPFQYQRQRSDRHRNRHFYIPHGVSNIYTGREDVSHAVEDSLLGPGVETLRQQRRFIIHGIGGSGKTQFCSKFAQDHRERFWGIFWIDATSAETAEQSFARIGKLGGMEATQSAGKHWLSNLEEPWLLIINNADDPTLNIQNLFPEGERGYVLVSTRNPHLRAHATVGYMKFEGLQDREALLLLLRAAGIPSPWDPVTESFGNKITRALGHLALALIQAGAVILQRICGFQDYLDFYEQHRTKLTGRHSSKGIREMDQFTVYATWDLSLNSLELRSTESSMDAAQILSIVAFFHFEHIRVDIFTRALANRLEVNKRVPDKSFLSNLWYGIRNRLNPRPILPDFLRQDNSRVDQYRIRRALHELCSFSLISYDSRDESFSLHPLVHSWARDRLEKGGQRLWAHIALSVLAESILLPPMDVGEYHQEFRRDIIPHLDSCLKACPIQILDYKARFGGMKFPLAIVLQHSWLLVFRDQVLRAAKCGYVYSERGRFNDAALLLSGVKNALAASRGYQHESTMRAMLALSAVYWGLGRLEEAVELQKIVVEARKRAYGPEHPDTLNAMDQLGRSYWLNGQYKDALELQTLTTTRMKARLGSHHPDTLMAMDNLGVTYGSWQRYDESREIHQQVLAERKKNLGETEVNTLTTMNNLAMALKDLGHLQEAKELMTKVYSERKLQLGKEHPWTLWALCNLAKVDIEEGNYQAAEAMLVPGIAAAKRSLNEDHLGVLMGEGELARLFARQGRVHKAEDLLVNVVHRLERSRGLHHPDTLYTLSKLARLYEQLENINKAVEVCELAAERVDDRLTQEHPLAQRIKSRLKGLKDRQNSDHDANGMASAEEERVLPSTSGDSSRFRTNIGLRKLRKHETF